MPDVQTPDQNVATATTESTPTGTPQEQARAAVYNDYSKLYAAPVAVAEPAVEEITPAEPVAQAPDLQALYTQQNEVINELRNQIEALKPKPVAPAPVVDQTAKKVAMEEWVTLMSQGDYAKAEDLLLEVLGPKLQQKMQPQIVQQSVEANNAEREINQFVATFESENSDLMHLKDYVVLGAEKRLERAQNEGKIKSPADFVREYKLAVTEETNTLRKQFQLTRAAGKEEALITRRDVLSATTMEPSGLQQPQSNSKSQVVATPLDYIAERRAKMAGYQGMR